ncbi:(d)CMP kinase [Picrophilus oshimae]|uniref:Cytidylate kinase n=1 Tax=Picrophilus torridus (strain ATCC 700027 / DSM 9790 / JCM 10055 / NBRC 100828 / KAW 2/3) TaxID=1122961 RepID=Q6L1A1_PICTO|nr:AAA family ATPase [Picrophilus oshimae]AAT43251.1 cytidylate kinase [Picrophilus oshimae DSM 9789]SMD30443.1 cytidylate kinase [Picrophilus oshimae DSM 9789]
MRITISGKSGSGKTTVGRLLADKLHYSFISGGYFFRKKAEEFNMNLLEFNKYSESHPEIDYEQDKMLLNFLKNNDNIVLESRLSSYIAYTNNIEAFKIYLYASDDIRYKRLMERDKTDILTLNERYRSEILRYMEFYGIDYNNYIYYDIIIDTDKKSPDEIVNDIIEFKKIKCR